MLLLAAAWAFAEATLFFLVADVPISWIAVRRGWRPAALAAVAAAFAATLGGALIHGWAAADPAGAQRAIAALPGIDEAMIAETARSFAERGYPAMLAGAFSGIPYKLFALAAGGEGRALLPFLLLSPLARLPRFLAAAALAAAIGKWLARWVGLRGRLVLLAAFWFLFYAVYFAVMPR